MGGRFQRFTPEETRKVWWKEGFIGPFESALSRSCGGAPVTGRPLSQNARRRYPPSPPARTGFPTNDKPSSLKDQSYMPRGASAPLDVTCSLKTPCPKGDGLPLTFQRVDGDSAHELLTAFVFPSPLPRAMTTTTGGRLRSGPLYPHSNSPRRRCRVLSAVGALILLWALAIQAAARHWALPSFWFCGSLSPCRCFFIMHDLRPPSRCSSSRTLTSRWLPVRIGQPPFPRLAWSGGSILPHPHQWRLERFTAGVVTSSPAKDFAPVDSQASSGSMGYCAHPLEWPSRGSITSPFPTAAGPACRRSAPRARPGYPRTAEFLAAAAYSVCVIGILILAGPSLGLRIRAGA